MPGRNQIILTDILFELILYVARFFFLFKSSGDCDPHCCADYNNILCVYLLPFITVPSRRSFKPHKAAQRAVVTDTANAAAG